MLDDHGDFRTHFVREPANLRDDPALVLNAVFRPINCHPLSLWSWKKVLMAVQVTTDLMRSQREAIRIPLIVVSKDFVKTKKRVAFTRFFFFLRDAFCDAVPRYQAEQEPC